ncbi:MAG: Gfo/Idh/MocA family oxidoreductase [Anaerolineae bacterium]
MNGRSILRVAIIGTGGIARGQHIPGYQLVNNVEIVALCDADPNTLHRVGEELGVDNLTSDWREIVAAREIDAVSICTYPNTHHAISMAALAEGKHVFCEKPLALTYPLAREMAEAAETANVKTAVGFTHRLTPAAYLAHHLISTGALGEIYQIVVVYSMGAADFRSRPATERATRAVTGGGPLFELGPHMVDMVRWWTGKEFLSICAQNRTFVKQRQHVETGEWVPVDIEDASTFLADLEGDTMAVFSHSRAITGRNFDQRVEVYGSTGALLYDQARPYELRACLGEQMVNLCAGYGIYDPLWGIYRQEEPYPVIPVPRRFIDELPGAREGKPVRSFAPAFIDAIRGGAPPILPTFHDGMKAQQVLDAVLESAEKRRWVDVGEDA